MAQPWLAIIPTPKPRQPGCMGRSEWNVRGLAPPRMFLCILQFMFLPTIR